MTAERPDVTAARMVMGRPPGSIRCSPYGTSDPRHADEHVLFFIHKSETSHWFQTLHIHGTLDELKAFSEAVALAVSEAYALVAAVEESAPDPAPRRRSWWNEGPS